VINRRIEILLTEKFKEEEFEDCYVVDITSGAGSRLDVYIDSDSGMTFTKCRKVSRYLESFIEEENLMGEKYVLNVSSPGIERPLKFARQYKKNIGRKVEVQLLDGEKKTGTLALIEDDTIYIEAKVRVKEGKKKKTMMVTSEIKLDQIKKTIVKVTF